MNTHIRPARSRRWAAVATAVVAVVALGAGIGSAHAEAPLGTDHAKGADQAAQSESVAAAAQTPGIDVSGHQQNVDWASWWAKGTKFAYVKATEGTSYRNPYFAQQYNGSYNVGMIRGAYHYARPGNSSGEAQAEYFVSHGGGWSRDGKTLPGALDLENSTGSEFCYGLTPSAMVAWIRAFTTRYKAKTGRDAVIYTRANWWNQCTGNNTSFAATNPLWVSRVSSTVGDLPAGWTYYTFWQYSFTPVDQNHFNGAYTRLQALANG